ncbi:MAG: hypothetical protein H7099_17540 [Gemmatimonadaceae bacterium]|nr:hypothetical protein [Gemmatimonadaceae bacterium]
MASIYLHPFTGAAATNGSAATPTTGSALSLSTGTEGTLTGSGELQGGSGDGYYDIPTSSFGDGTIKLAFTPPAGFTGQIRFFFRCQASSAVWNNDGSAIFFGDPVFSQTTDLEDRAPSNGIDSILASAAGLTALTPATAWIRLDGSRVRVWLNGNTGTPDIDVSTLSRTTGFFGLLINGSTSRYDTIDIDDTPTSPAPPPRNDNQVPRRILGRMTRNRTLRAA